MAEHQKSRTQGASPGTGGTEHDPLPFEQRYRQALENEQLQRNLLNFQRSWRVSRETAFAAYDENPERVEVEPVEPGAGHLPLPNGTDEFRAMRDRLAAIKDEVIEHLPDYVDRFQRAAEERGAIVYRAADAED